MVQSNTPLKLLDNPGSFFSTTSAVKKIQKVERESNLKIVRDGKEYELTSEELAAANAEFVTNFMKSEMMGRCEISDEELAEELAEKAYDRYCEGNGETEGECIDWAYYSWLESTRED